MPLATSMARAYVNHGRWIADCPNDCGSALELEPGKYTFNCVECLVISVIDWPDNAQEIWDALQERPYPKVRHWFPAGHELALRAGCPHGQTVEELRREAYDHGVDKS